MATLPAWLAREPAGGRGPHRARRSGTGGEDRRPGPHDHGCRTAPRGVHLTGVHGAAVRVTGRTPEPLPLPRGPSPHRRRRARGQVRGAGGGALRRPQYLEGGRGVGPGSPPARAITASPAPPNALRRGCARRETSRRPSGACSRKVRTGTPSSGRSETNLGSRARGTTAQTGSGERAAERSVAPAPLPGGYARKPCSARVRSKNLSQLAAIRPAIACSSARFSRATAAVSSSPARPASRSRSS